MDFYNDGDYELTVGKIPTYLFKYFTLFLILFFFITFLFAYKIKTPDLIKASFKLTSSDYPVIIRSSIDGRITKLLVKDNDFVKKGQLIGYMESTANHEEILILSNLIKNLLIEIQNDNYTNVKDLSNFNFYNLGELQTAYQAFEQKRLELTYYLSNGFYSSRRSLVEMDIKNIQKLDTNLYQHLYLLLEDLKIVESEYDIQRTLEKDKVIAPLDLIREGGKVLSKKVPIKSIEASIIQNNNNRLMKFKELLELDNIAKERKFSFIQALSTLSTEIDMWQVKYILRSNVSGKIIFNKFIQENEYFSTHQEVAFIVPQFSNYVGELRIPQNNFGKVQVGQNVQIRMDGYPFKEYGYLKGKISSISGVAINDSVFLAKVTLDKGLVTTYGKKINYRVGMTANADIVTSNRRLYQRIISLLFL